jgi:hypothetical protein
MMLPSHKLNALVPLKNFHTYDLRTCHNLLVPRFRTERFSNSFIPTACSCFNNDETVNLWFKYRLVFTAITGMAKQEVALPDMTTGARLWPIISIQISIHNIHTSIYIRL